MIAVFAVLACITLLSAFGVVISRSVVHSALFMAGAFLGVAGFYVMLHSPALAALQVLIYVGAVTVVILFGIMFTQKPQARRFRMILNRQVWGGFVVAAGVAAILIYVFLEQDWGGTSPGHGPRLVAQLGRILVGTGGAPQIFGLLFEVSSVLLLVATVAAIVISRRRPERPTERGGE
ncbi:NADH-quinone oxidoreductase subunit J [Rubrobacter naiadicus]|uniref:NADH-quinone oxidoreductase subunit J family protein n=1 Tax=Rubrobacter naiadicus TaxID=1392641 RepID=UPI0023621503|nr:NADH-quinone oxidoreductase subunit J [Rubrobacter naiadicus]